MTRSVHAVVVAYHAVDELERCLDALGGETEVTVVDNSSLPAVDAMVRRYRFEYLDPGRNLGFGAGVNRALREILARSPRDVLLLNPDAILEPGAIEKLGGYLGRQENERVAAVSPVLVRGDGTPQRVEWPFPTPLGAWADAVGFTAKRGGHKAFVIGAVMLLRWEALHDVGLFDERFFLYAEEADWQRRALALGWTSAVCNDAIARHQGAGTSQDPRRREMLFHAGQETYIRKWHGRGGWFAYRSAACLGASVRAALLAGDRRAEAGRRALLYLRGPRRCARLVGE